MEKIIIINNERIFVSRIRSYSIKGMEFVFRNRRKSSLLASHKDLFDTCNVDYLYMELNEAPAPYKFYSNADVKSEAEKMEEYLSNAKKHASAEWREYEKKAQDSLAEVKGLSFTEQDIMELVKKLDEVYEIINK